LRSFLKEGNKFPEVMDCYHLTGTFDFLLKIAIRDMTGYNVFLMNKLSALPNIGVVQSFFVLSEGKAETAYELAIPAAGKKINRK
jgi:Lrp/AsnC family leucine-responsive transcriptional regulator